jgi:glutamate 5-kinase
MTAPVPSSSRPQWAEARRIVVKIGSSLLVDRTLGAINAAWLDSLAGDVADLARAGRQVILVSSGAIALGRHVLGLARGPLELEKSQAAAAVGQISLAGAYQAVLKAHGLTAAQILLTLGDTEERRRYLNARQTIATLLAHGAVPVVNENDTVATSEIRYGDNDRLSARVASMMSADCLVLLSDVDGLYTAPPGSGVKAERLDEVRSITSEIEAMAGAAGTELSRGGMVTKIEAGKIALSSGTDMVITSGKVLHPLRASAGSPGSWNPRAAWPSTPGPSRPCWRARACCRPASRGWKAPSSAAMPSSSAPPTAASWGAASSPMHAPTQDVSSASGAARSPPSSATPAGPSWCTATIWC